MLIDPVPEPLVKEFRTEADKIIGKKKVKIWLTKKSGHRVDTLTTIGTAQKQPVKMFDHGAGFYLMGEGITPELLAPLHSIFASFCRKMKDHRDKNQFHRMELRYRSVHEADPYWYNRLVMHYPFAAPTTGGTDVEPF